MTNENENQVLVKKQDDTQSKKSKYKKEKL